MQQFVFYDKSKVEMETIIEVLTSENITYKIQKFLVKDFIFDEEEDEDFIIVEELYNIICYTDLEHFDFVKYLSIEKIEYKLSLERFYLLPPYIKGKQGNKKNVSRISKKNITNTNKRNKSKQKG